MTSKFEPGDKSPHDPGDEPIEENDVELGLLPVTQETDSQYEAKEENSAELKNSTYDSLDSSCTTNSPLPLDSRTWILKTPSFYFLSKITFKWTGSNKEIFKITLAVSQILLILVLFNKITILKLENAALHQRTNNIERRARLTNYLIEKDDFNTSKTNPERSEQSTNYWDSASTTVSPPKTCISIEAFSVADLEDKLENISKTASVCLNIKSEDHSTWQMQNSSIDAEIVKEVVLSGCFDMAILPEILEKFKFAYKITFGQKNAIFCNKNPESWFDYNLKYLQKAKTNLLNLSEIVFESINCTKIFNFLSKSFYMNGITGLKIKGIDIDETNILGIRQLLQQFKYSLEILHFTDVLWKTSLFDNFSYDIPQLIELQIDFVAQNDTNINYFQGFNAAEKILTIRSLKGFLPFEQFSSLLKFKLLKNLVTGVEISDEVTTLDSLFPVDSLPNLDSMELYLKFSNISKCYLLLDYAIKRSYKIRLHNNCDVNF